MSLKSQALRLAAGYVAEHWTQGAYRRRSGAVCAVGAIEKAARKLRMNAFDVSVLRDCFTVYGIGDMTAHAQTWNDMPGRTAAEVETALRLAAVLVDAKRSPTGRIIRRRPALQNIRRTGTAIAA